MPAAIEFVQNHPLYGLAAALFLAFIVLTIAKKLVVFALIGVLGFIGYGYYLHTRGEEERMPKVNVQKVIEKLEDAAEKAKEKAKDALDRE
ncbi:MAG: hypothetical protein IT381_07735 [Deltaproteobacteria bacterium]|nr:hypothetical protein [Deltaproteobacteria bacterium]